MQHGNPLEKCTGFEWDKDNSIKNWEKHGVTNLECEQIFFNQPLILHPDKKHSQKETRYYVLGQTDAFRKLFLVFTIRNNLIRVISARNMSRAELKEYDRLK